MREVGVHEARTKLAKLLREVEAGEVVVIRRHGAPIARLVPVREGGGGAAAHDAAPAERSAAPAERPDAPAPLGAAPADDLES